MRDVLADYDAFLARGERVGRAVLIEVFGSAPQPEGATLLVTAGGSLAGSVSGGCVEGVTAEAVRESMERGAGRTETFSVTDELAWDVGLPCGGTIRVLVEPAVRDEIVAAARGPGGVVVATSIDPLAAPAHAAGAVGGAWVAVCDDGAVEAPRPVPWLGPAQAEAAVGRLAAVAPAVDAAARDALTRESSRTRRFEAPDGSAVAVFLEVFGRRPTLVLFGAGHVAVALVPLAKQLGYTTVVADPREAFLSRERFPEADELVRAWPEEAFARIGLGPGTFVCVLSHDPKVDDPALLAALRSPAAYVGALGSRKNQRERRARLRAAGLTDVELGRLHGPIGLDLGGRRPAETALAILAEMIAVRYRGSARPKSEGFVKEGGRRPDAA